MNPFLEDIETNGDPLLEEILEEVFEEVFLPTMDFRTPPDVVPHDLITTLNIPPVNKPPQPSTEPRLPPWVKRKGLPKKTFCLNGNFLL